MNVGNDGSVEDNGKRMKIRLTRRILFGGVPVVAALILTGCASVSENTHAYLGSPQLAATSPAAVQIFPAEPKQPKELLGEVILTVSGNPSRQILEAKLKAGAAHLGATGVFIASDRTHIYPVTYVDCFGPEPSEYSDRLIVGVAFINR